MTKRMGLKPQGARVVKGEWRERTTVRTDAEEGELGGTGRWEAGARRHPTVDGWDRGPPGGRCQPKEAAAGQSGPVQPEGGVRSPAAGNSGVMGVKGRPLSRTPLGKGKQGRREMD